MTRNILAPSNTTLGVLFDEAKCLAHHLEQNISILYPFILSLFSKLLLGVKREVLVVIQQHQVQSEILPHIIRVSSVLTLLN